MVHTFIWEWIQSKIRPKYAHTISKCHVHKRVEKIYYMRKRDKMIFFIVFNENIHSEHITSQYNCSNSIEMTRSYQKWKKKEKTGLFLQDWIGCHTFVVVYLLIAITIHTAWSMICSFSIKRLNIGCYCYCYCCSLVSLLNVRIECKMSICSKATRPTKTAFFQRVCIVLWLLTFQCLTFAEFIFICKHSFFLFVCSFHFASFEITSFCLVVFFSLYLPFLFQLAI